MKTSETFQEFISNIKIPQDKADTISYRYGRIVLFPLLGTFKNRVFI